MTHGFIRAFIALALFLGCSATPTGRAQSSDPSVIATIRAQAARDDPDALFALAIINEVGRDAPKNAAEAVRLLERAAAKGHAPSKTQLGLMYQTGRGTAIDRNRAHSLFGEAAAAGDVEGQFRLAMSLVYGIGTSAQPTEARRWLASAANQGHQEAQFALGVMLQQGIGGPKNEFAARRWLRDAMTGSDARVSAEAKPLFQELDKRLLYKGMTAGEVLAAAAILATAFALAADYFGVGQSSFQQNPNHYLNPNNYDALGTTRRRQNCRFVSRRTGMDITIGKSASMYGSGNMWVCD